MARKILVILTSHGPSDAAQEGVYGWFLPELAHPFEMWVEAGVEIVVASPKGGITFVSEDSLEMYSDDEACNKFLEMKNIWQETARISSYLGKSDAFDAIFIPGGIGPLYDLAEDTKVQNLVSEFYEQGKVVSAICHGQAALINVQLTNGNALLAGKQVTAFPESDEDRAGHGHLFPFRLESKMRQISGVRMEIASEPFGEKVVTDGKLVTGQNPASARKLASAVLSLM